jgi:hypothetical protein
MKGFFCGGCVFSYSIFPREVHLLFTIEFLSLRYRLYTEIQMIDLYVSQKIPCYI